MGYSRDSFYRHQKAKDEGGVEALINESRRKPNRKNRVAKEIEDEVVKLSIEEPAWGNVRASNELRKEGISISPGEIRFIQIRNNLENMKKEIICT